MRKAVILPDKTGSTRLHVADHTELG